MNFVKKNKNILFSLLVVCLLGIFQALQTYFYKEYDSRYIIEDVSGVALGKIILWTIIPLIIAVISKFVLKKQFGSIFLKSVLIVSIPLSLFDSYWHYNEYVKNTKPSIPIATSESDKFKDVKKILQLSQVPNLMSNRLNQLMAEGDKKARSINPNIPDYVFDGMNQKMKSVMQAMIWEENGLMDQYVQIFAKHFTDEQVEKLLNFYENPLWKKTNSNKSLTEAEKNKFNELSKYTFSKDITARNVIISKEMEAAVKEWLKYVLKKGKAEMNDYLKSFGYTLDGYKLNRIE